ncbi:DMT family transporter [Sphingobium rhizovicinum]|uniref:DMT family transporter n=1 Tax=Sphingobium rhizovicinum TaxID=432308 RepID=A0ABV7NDT1_9SPHN
MSGKIRQDGRATIIGACAVLASLTSVTLGAAIAKTLFPVVGAYGITSLRVGLGAILLLLFRRPWRRPIPSRLRWPLLAYGAVLGLMNILIYQAFARIPIGIAIAIEVIGPLAVVLFGSRRPRDFLWLAAAVAGLLLLLPLRSDAALDPAGVGFALAAAACWATYILTGKRVSGALGGDAVAWGMLVAAIVILPVGLAEQNAALFSAHVLLLGIAIAILSSALPYSLDMEAMRRLPAPVFGLMVSSAPAVGAVIGFLLLGERLSPLQWIAILCIMAASGGSALTAGRKPAIEETPQ